MISLDTIIRIKNIFTTEFNAPNPLKGALSITPLQGGRGADKTQI